MLMIIMMMIVMKMIIMMMIVMRMITILAMVMALIVIDMTTTSAIVGSFVPINNCLTTKKIMVLQLNGKSAIVFVMMEFHIIDDKYPLCISIVSACPSILTSLSCIF